MHELTDEERTTDQLLSFFMLHALAGCFSRVLNYVTAKRVCFTYFVLVILRPLKCNCRDVQIEGLHAKRAISEGKLCSGSAADRPSALATLLRFRFRQPEAFVRIENHEGNRQSKGSQWIRASKGLR